MECFVIIVNGFEPLTIITKHSILDVAAALNPPLGWTTSINNLYMYKWRIDHKFLSLVIKKAWCTWVFLDHFRETNEQHCTPCFNRINSVVMICLDSMYFVVAWMYETRICNWYLLYWQLNKWVVRTKWAICFLAHI